MLRKMILLIGCFVVCRGVSLADPPSNYEGFGAVTRGALDAPGGYETYHVTSLSDDGSAGTLRAAIGGDSAGSRRVVFDVGGDINLTVSLHIWSSYITIDGSTAPSPGITIYPHGYIFDVEGYQMYGSTHDIIINNLRIDGGGSGEDIFALTGWSRPVYNVIADHCTFTNSGDGCLDMAGDVHNVTMSWNLIHNSDLGTLLSYSSIDPTWSRKDISIHHNVWAKNGERQPRLYRDCDTIDVVNNVVYGWDYIGGMRISYVESVVNPSANIENNVIHLWANGFYDLPEQGFMFERGEDEGDVYINGNIAPSECPQDGDGSVQVPLTIPVEYQVTKYAASTLGDTVVPFVGTHYPTTAEQNLLDEVSNAIGGQKYLMAKNIERK
jgi:pectate lyase